MVQVGPPPVRRAEPPGPSASVEELEASGDQLRAEKDYLDAMDYYVAAFAEIHQQRQPAEQDGDLQSDDAAL